MKKWLLWGLFAGMMIACNPSSESLDDTDLMSFELIPAERSGVDFVNSVENQENFNILTYRNYYNGGGVAVGDIDNDGLPDLYFTANMGPNKLYRNNGDLEFTDITELAGVAGTRYWSTGVTMADVNADGLLDIYVSNSGDIALENKENELFINNGDLTFTERAAEYGLNNLGYSTHASFFDYDLDGDLDCFVLNNSYKDPDRIALYARERAKVDSLGGDKLYRNDGGTFTDVTVDAGIFTSQIGFGLGVSVGDLNGDWWPDIYISNDFWERDYLYINQQDGTFKEDLPARMSYTSVSSMGSDIADINNDGYLDLFSTDMLPPDNHRLKAATKFTEYHLEDYRFRSNYHYQLLQNCLQMNDGTASFRETAFLSGLSATDWSWGALIFDIDLDGAKDIFVSNGVYHDITDQDFIDFIADKDAIKEVVAQKGSYDFRDFLPYLPHNKRRNYAFINNGQLIFENKARALGLDQESYSNGSAYGDLDGDGDYDLVVNNVNMPAFVYENRANESGKHFLKVRFAGPESNRFGLGATVRIHHGDVQQTAHNMTARGFESSVPPEIIFGLGEEMRVDSLVVVWPDLSQQRIYNVPVDTTLVLAASGIQGTTKMPQQAGGWFTNVSDKINPDRAAHKENVYNDFDHERLMPHMMSREGPAVVRGDVDHDGVEDMVLLGAAGDPDKLLLGTADGFRYKALPAFNSDKGSESVCGALFDMDQDLDLDLLVGVGGNEYAKGFTTFSTRAYINDGNGNFQRTNIGVPLAGGQIGCIVPQDFDQDGDTDVFIGGKAVPGAYGLVPRSFMLRNEGGGNWTDITNETTGPIGMVTDAVWHDVNRDGSKDLITVGMWMPVTIFANTGTEIIKVTEIPNSQGWWNCIEAGDLDGDGDDDFLLGNWGTNMKFQPTEERPLNLYVNDFDANNRPECIIEWYPPADDLPYPFASKMDITAQMPELKKSILKYHDYAASQIGDLFSEESIQQAYKATVTNMHTSILWNRDSTVQLESLMVDAQMSPVFSAVIEDLDKDGITDFYLGGNFYGLKPEVGRLDGNHGGYFKGVGDGKYVFVNSRISGIRTSGEVRDALYIQNTLVLARNNGSLQAFQF